MSHQPGAKALQLRMLREAKDAERRDRTKALALLKSVPGLELNAKPSKPSKPKKGKRR